MILPDRQPILGIGIFLGDAWTDHFRKSVDIDRIEPHAALDFGAHAFGPRLGAEQRDAQRGFARIDALAIELVGDGKQIRRRHRDDVGLEIADQLHLALGETAADRDHRAAEIFGAVMKAQTAGEQPIAIGDVHLVAGFAAGGADSPRAISIAQVSMSPRV